MFMKTFKLDEILNHILNHLPFKSLEKIKYEQSVKTKSTAFDHPQVEHKYSLSFFIPVTDTLLKQAGSKLGSYLYHQNRPSERF